MAKKVKCMECTKSMHWALPRQVGVQNYEYAKECLCSAKKSIVCGETMKTKRVDHEQYCKKFVCKTEKDKQCDSVYSGKINKLEDLIRVYESKCGCKRKGEDD